MIVMNGAVGPITAKKNSSSEPRTEAEAGHGYSQSATVYWLVVVEHKGWAGCGGGTCYELRLSEPKHISRVSQFVRSKCCSSTQTHSHTGTHTHLRRAHAVGFLASCRTCDNQQFGADPLSPSSSSDPLCLYSLALHCLLAITTLQC